jgi:nicotinamide-nucleotide amidase
MPAMNLKQAQRPRTFRCLPNPHGTAPGIAGAIGGCLVFCLPGPPREMQPMFHAQVLPALPHAGSEEVILTGAVPEFGMGESVAAEKLGDLMRRDRNPLVGTTASESIVTARVRVQGPREWAREQVSQTLSHIREAWRPYAFGEGEATLGDALASVLLEKRLRLATAESCTGGWLGKLITDRAGSSAYYLGGWVTYANAMKESQLDVPGDMIDRLGAVSMEVAGAMARGALSRAGADCALAITGIAGPDGGSKDKPVGTVFIAAALAGTPQSPGQVHVRRFEFPGDRAAIRDRSAKAALQLLRFALLGVARMPMIWDVTRPVPAVAQPSGGVASQ